MRAHTASLLLSCPRALRGREKGGVEGVGFRYNHLLEAWLRPPTLLFWQEPLGSSSDSSVHPWLCTLFLLTPPLLLLLLLLRLLLFLFPSAANTPLLSSPLPPADFPSHRLQPSPALFKMHLLRSRSRKLAVCNHIWDGLGNWFVLYYQIKRIIFIQAGAAKVLSWTNKGSYY